MYSLDINFIRDRPEYTLKNAGAKQLKLLAGDTTPLYLGIAIGVILPAMIGGAWLVLQTRIGQLEAENAELDAELSRLGLQEQEIQTTQAQINQIRTETQALATVFNQIRPWSAMLQDMRDRIPRAVQIETIRQTAAATPQPSPQAANNNNNQQQQQEGQDQQNAEQQQQNQQTAQVPAGNIEIAGIARSFNDVNDFLLTLQQSAFLKPTDTRIVTAELVDIAEPGTVAVPQANSTAVVTPQAVRYTIQSTLSDVPASELLRELERKGTLGLVTRIRTLQQKGVIQQ
ncbi:PilN domain-containing protein [Chroogloeocystis siderophila]|jgi:type IV pilus assembly protein PilN|uniref:Fimbrial protein n=1 Tax=Chroogloeocystis siderophila 5.2 s.c.1 TaxID=247279 RepID=A0A1U7HX43_9CHRO|nr:PilN domain-containing protein [Chroogloeocystis siderophila]OKH28156.1 fimbrial protein [Chroogloeocystis siderophila 5.2 s.c.1]